MPTTINKRSQNTVKKLDFVITKQGIPKVNFAYFLAADDPEVIIVGIDMPSRRTVGFGYGLNEEGAPTYDIIDSAEDKRSSVTTAAFPTLKGYEIAVFDRCDCHTHTLVFTKIK